MVPDGPASHLATAGDATSAIRRSHRLRLLGHSLGGLMIAVVFARQRAPAPVWALLGLHALVWPHVSWWLLQRSTDAIALDRRLLLADAAMGGVWIALMQFSLLPTILVFTVFAMTLALVGGWSLFARGAAAQVMACAMAAAANGFAFAPRTDTVELVASLPLLVAYPMALAFAMGALAQRIHAQNAELVRAGSIDSVSGLLNRSRWDASLAAALRTQRCTEAVMLLMDIDGFKRVNDRYGHTVGDDVIRQIGAIIRASVRERDLAGRYGGDEFGVVLFDVDPRAAAAIGERIRAEISGSLFEHAPGLRCTLSVGAARCPAATHTAPEWVREADACLYRAKLAGRDRLSLAS